ncbi:hypothetical protein N9M80_04545, partial [Flavobacteriales bacterium]|nr:hypothetical protein [Flavobacteriales bacterium]
NPNVKPSFLLNEHTQPEDLVDLLQWFKSDQDIALLSDAGAPGVADPGAAAVRMAHNAGWRGSACRPQFDSARPYGVWHEWAKFRIQGVLAT